MYFLQQWIFSFNVKIRKNSDFNTQIHITVEKKKQNNASSLIMKHFSTLQYIVKKRAFDKI